VAQATSIQIKDALYTTHFFPFHKKVLELLSA